MICLQNICLGVITEEFERFYFAFTTSNNDNFKRDFEFLQRQYSYELGSQLLSKEKLKDEYLEFLLNDYLSIFDELWLKNSRYKNSMKDIFCRLPNFTKISCFISSDEMLENLAKFCPKIVEIYAKISCVTDEGVNYLCKNDNGNFPCPKLKKLSIDSRGLTIKGLALIIQNLKSLEKLDNDRVPLALYYIHKEDLLKLEKVSTYNLVELKFYDGCHIFPYYTDVLKICRTVCPRLKSLSCPISNNEQLDLFNNIFLEHLDITFYRKFNIDSFLKLCGCKLTSLVVGNCIMSISEFPVSCPKLQTLTLDNVHFTDDHSGSKADFHFLVACSFYKIEFNRTSYRAMCLLFLSSPNIEDVNFICCDLSPDTKTYILRCCEKHPLKSISFLECMDLETNFLKDVLLSSPSLKTLKICDFHFTEQKEIIQFSETLSKKPYIVFQEWR